MTTNARCVLLIALGIGLAPGARAADPYLVQVPATFDSPAAIEEVIRRECGLELFLGNHVLRRVSVKFPFSAQIQKADGTEKGKVLNVSIVSITGAGGSSWTGPKSMTVRADVVQTGKVIATTVKTRDSMGGMFGAVRGRCSILERIAIVLARDIAEWLPGTLIAPAGETPEPATPDPAADPLEKDD